MLANNGRPVRAVSRSDRGNGPSQIYMSHDVLGRPPEGQWIQYRSRNRLDCRKGNLRLRTRYKDQWGELNRWRKYGMDEPRYQEMLEAQNGRCAICGKTADERGESDYGRGQVPASKRRLHVDHSHVTGHVRELLCWSCNIGLGKFGDDPALLRAAADYLIRHNPFAVSP